ncbi:MAG: microcystin-dependent protein [Myxococcota bacterium]|jgi:microcystin-dependent protein
MTPFLGQIMMFGGNFAPRGWAMCDGQLLAISQYSALFSILGTTYGGDGVSTFGLPDLRSRSPMHAGTGPGLGHKTLGAKGGHETVTLTTNQLPAHNHTLIADNKNAKQTSPVGNYLAISDGIDVYRDDIDSPAALNSGSIGPAGGGQSVNIESPYQVVTIVIALEGVYPSRS